jgi:hypothetical protein
MRRISVWILDDEYSFIKTNSFHGEVSHFLRKSVKEFIRGKRSEEKGDNKRKRV